MHNSKRPHLRVICHRCLQTTCLGGEWSESHPQCNNLTIHYTSHDDVIKWKHFPRYWPFVRGIHRWPVNSPHKGQWRGALMFSLMCLNKRLSKQWWGRWFQAPSCPLWRRCNDNMLSRNLFKLRFVLLCWNIFCISVMAKLFIFSLFQVTSVINSEIIRTTAGIAMAITASSNVYVISALMLFSAGEFIRLI